MTQEPMDGVCEISERRAHVMAQIVKAAREIISSTESGDFVFAESMKRCESYELLAGAVERLDRLQVLEDAGWAPQELTQLNKVWQQSRDDKYRPEQGGGQS